MSSKTSIISLFVLVLATCCYSLPVEDQFHDSTLPTPTHEYSTGTTIVEHEVNVNMRLITPEESSDIPNIHSEHKYDEHHSEHVPTDEVSHQTRLSKEMSSTFTTQSPSSVHLTHAERSFNDFSFTTMESKTQFNERSINSLTLNRDEETEKSERYFPGQEHHLEMTTVSEPREFTTSETEPREFTTSFEFHPREFTTSESEPREFTTSESEPREFTTSESEPREFTTSESEPREFTTSESQQRKFTTSVDSFGKFTGLLPTDRKEETTESMKFEQSSPSTTTIKFEKEDQSIEETTSKPQQLVKTFSFIPGKITETKIFDNEASKAYFMRHPEQHQQQLSQGQKQSIVKTQESDN